MALYDHVKSSNAAYAAAFTKGDLPMPPAKKAAFVVRSSPPLHVRLSASPTLRAI